MRLRRMLAEGVGYYHVISRIAGQQFLVDDREKDVLRNFKGLSPKLSLRRGDGCGRVVEMKGGAV